MLQYAAQHLQQSSLFMCSYEVNGFNVIVNNEQRGDKVSLRKVKPKGGKHHATAIGSVSLSLELFWI